MKTTSADAPPIHADRQTTQPAAPAPAPEAPSEHERRAKVSDHAYFLAMARGFTPGYELDDWVAAEQALEESTSAQAA